MVIICVFEDVIVLLEHLPISNSDKKGCVHIDIILTQVDIYLSTSNIRFMCSFSSKTYV